MENNQIGNGNFFANNSNVSYSNISNSNIINAEKVVCFNINIDKDNYQLVEEMICKICANIDNSNIIFCSDQVKFAK